MNSTHVPCLKRLSSLQSDFVLSLKCGSKGLGFFGQRSSQTELIPSFISQPEGNQRNEPNWSESFKLKCHFSFKFKFCIVVHHWKGINTLLRTLLLGIPSICILPRFARKEHSYEKFRSLINLKPFVRVEVNDDKWEIQGLRVSVNVSSKIELKSKARD